MNSTRQYDCIQVLNVTTYPLSQLCLLHLLFNHLRFFASYDACVVRVGIELARNLKDSCPASLTQLIIVESWTFSPTKNRQRSALLAKTDTRFTAMLMPIISHLFKGLIGCLIVCKKGTLEQNKPWKRKDVDHEFCLRFALTNEGFSWYLNENMNLAGNASTIDASK